MAIKVGRLRLQNLLNNFICPSALSACVYLRLCQGFLIFALSKE